jgi:hypothetical protein
MAKMGDIQLTYRPVLNIQCWNYHKMQFPVSMSSTQGIYC